MFSKLKIEKFDDQELFDVIKTHLFTAVVGDVMDKMGLTHQFLPPDIQALSSEMIVVGRAMTVQESDCTGTKIHNENKDKPFGLMFEALDNLIKNDVYICACASKSFACFGALMATRALVLGAAGAVVEGFSRDSKDLNTMGFPIFSSGKYAQDQGVRGRVIDYNCPIEFSNKVVIHPGDIVFGDIDGVAIIPKTHEKKIIFEALEKALGEDLVKKALQEGLSSVQAFEKFGIM